VPRAGVSPGGYYARLRRPPSARARADVELSARIAAIHHRSRATCCAPRIHAELAEQGIRVGCKRGARLMRAAGFRGVSRRNWIITTGLNMLPNWQTKDTDKSSRRWPRRESASPACCSNSRLFRNPAGWCWETISVSHGKACAYLPVIDLLHSYFGIEPSDDARKRRERVAGRLVMLDPALDEARPYLFALLGLIETNDTLMQMSGEIRKRRTLDAVKRVLLRESLNHPLMVIFEDLQWIDDETQAPLNLLADSIGTAKILLLVNYRPEYSDQSNSKTYYTQLRLDPLGRESAEQMLASLLGDGKT
jgi:hypothetical protein